jgi:2-dehydropantoate 2-reductase
MKAVAIVGAGAIGSFLAARLLAAQAAVQVIARGQRLADLQRNGLRLEMDGAVQTLAVRAAAHGQELGQADLAILACKTTDFASAMASVQPCIGPGTILLSLQNGVEAPQQLAAAFPAATVLAARVHGFFELHGGVVRHVGVEPSITFGSIQGDSAAPHHVAQLLAAAGIRHQICANITAELWEKLLLAASFGGVGAAYALTAGDLREQPEALADLASAMAEVHALADASGIMLDGQCVARNMAFVMRFPAEARTSMQRDLEAGRPSEYDSLIGAVLRLADAANVATPTFAKLAEGIARRGLLARN